MARPLSNGKILVPTRWVQKLYMPFLPIVDQLKYHVTMLLFRRLSEYKIHKITDMKSTKFKISKKQNLLSIYLILFFDKYVPLTLLTFHIFKSTNRRTGLQEPFKIKVYSRASVNAFIIQTK